MIIRASKKALMRGLVFAACFATVGMGVAAQPAAMVRTKIDTGVVERFHNKHRLARRTDAEEISRSLKEIRSVARGKGSLQARKGQLAAKLHELSELKARVMTRMDEWERQGGLRANEDASKRRNALRRAVNERFRNLEEAIDAAANAGPANLAARMNALDAAVNSMQAPEDDRSTPGPVPTWTWRPPQPSKTIPASESLPDYLAAVDTGSEFRWVLSPLIKEAHAAAPGLPTEASSCGYTSGDLADDGMDVRLSAEIHALAEQLEYSPAKIFEYVSNEIDYEPYYGALKGSAGALKAGRAGATDQASLLIALLRASNIPARYVRGNVWVVDPSDLGADGRAANWMGTRTAKAAASVLAQGQHPVTVQLGGNQGVKLSHVWVEACVPYANYRGSSTQLSGYRWIPLDPSFEQSDYQSGISVNETFDYDAFLASRKHQPVEEAYAAQVFGILTSGNTLADVPYKGEKRHWKIEVLPTSLPYEVDVFTDWSNSGTPETSVLPASHRYRFTASANSGDASVDLDFPAIVHNRVTLSFKGASTSDQTQLDAWLNDGDAGSSAPCSVNVVPVIKVEGAAVATGSNAVGLCTTGNGLGLLVVMDESRNAPAPVNSVTFNSIKAASLYTLQASAFQWSDVYLAERAKRLNDAVFANNDPNLHLEDTEGELLYIAGQRYLRQVADARRLISGLHNGSGDSGNDLGVTAAQSKVEYLFDLPFAVYREGLLIDMPGGQSRNVDITTGNLDFEAFLLNGYASSLYESIIWQQMAHLDAVSTVRGMQFASESNIELLKLTSANWASESGKLTSNSDPSLNYSAAQVSSIKSNYIDQGYEVTLPRSQILYNNWQGEVFVAALNDTSDPNNPRASAGYIISGGYAGGMTTGDPVSTTTYDPAIDTGFYSPITTTSGDPYNATALNNGFNSNVSLEGDPVNVATGNFYHSETDIAIDGRGGFPLVFERTYNSRDPMDGPLGYGWTHSFNHYLTFDDDNFNGSDDAGDTDSVTSAVSWFDGTGGRKYFSAAATSGGIANGTAFASPAGVFVTAERTAAGTYQIRQKNGLTYTFESVAGTAGQTARLTSVTDRNGNSYSLQYDATGLDKVVDAAGRELDFTNANGRIERISDWTGREWQYVYDANGDLTEVQDPLTGSTSDHGPRLYSYYDATDGQMLAHHLSSYTLPRGNGMSFDYYPNGKVFRHTDDEGGVTTFTYNLFRRQTLVTNPRGYTRTFDFDEYGNLERLVEEGGGERSYEYTATDPTLRTAAVDPLGHRTEYLYDASGNVIQVIRPSGVSVAYADFNVFNRPQKVRDTRNNWSLLKYDANGNLTDEIQLKAGVDGGSITVTGYSPQANAADVAAWVKHSYNANGSLVQTQRMRDIAAAQGPTSTTTYDAAGLYPVQIERCVRTDRTGTIATECDSATLVHDALGRLEDGVDAGFEAVHYEYDALGRVIRGTDSVGQLRDYGYDPNGNAVFERLLVGGTQVDERAETYDALDRLDGRLDAGGHLTRYDYDAVGNVLKITDPDSYSLGFEYDPDNHWTRAEDKEGHSVERNLDVLGRPRVIVDPNGNRQTFHYYSAANDGRLERQCQVLDAGGERCTHFEYDAAGQVTALTEFYGSAEAATTYSQYDAQGRVLRVAEPAVNDPDYGLVHPVTCYTYDALGHVTQVRAGHTLDAAAGACSTDSVQIQASYDTDDLGNRLSETDALGRSWRFRYDQHGNNVRSEDPDGRVQTAVFNYGGLIASRTANDGSGDHRTRWIRNALGQPTRIAAPEVAYGYAYDAAHRLTRVTDSRGNVSLSYQWSPGGLLDRTEDSHGNQTDYLYDPVGRLIGLWAPNDDYVSFSHDAGGRLTDIQYPNGLNAHYQWNADGTLADLKHRVGPSDANLIFRHQYSYDDAGRRSQLIETLGGSNYTLDYQYDAGSRLLRVDENGSLVGQYGYDRFGNRRTHTDGTDTETYAYDAVHQLLNVQENGSPAAAYLYDQAGNLTRQCGGSGVTRPDDATCTGSELTSYSYDALSRMTTASRTGADPVSESYVYGPNNRRIRKNGTSYLYDGSDIHAEYTNGWSDPTAVISHGPGIDRPLIRATLSAGQFTNAGYYHADLLGSVLAYSDQAASIQGTQRFSAWGEQIASSGNDIPNYGYTGREPDGTGLIYYRARYYDPGVGRFTQRDPKGFIDGVNQYAYVANMPVNATDPNGLFLDTVLDIGFIVYDIGVLGYDLVANGGENWKVHTAALAADVAGAAVPFVTGAGATYRAANKLVDVAKQADALVPAGGRASTRGTAVHKEFDALIADGAAGRSVSPERAYVGGSPVPGYRPRGSSNPDAIVGNEYAPQAVFDLKTGNSGISNQQMAKYERNLPDGTPVYELRTSGHDVPRPHSYSGAGAAFNTGYLIGDYSGSNAPYSGADNGSLFNPSLIK